MMGFAIKAQIWFSGEKHVNENYTLLDDLEKLEAARRESPKFLTVKGWFDIFDEGYSFGVDSHVYNVYFPSQDLFEDFIVRSFSLAQADVVALSHDEEFAGLDTILYVVNDETLYEEVKSQEIRGKKPIVFLVKNEEILGETSFRETFEELERVSQNIRKEMEDSMFGGGGGETKVLSIQPDHQRIDGMPFFDIARDRYIIIGAKVKNQQELLSLMAATFGQDTYHYSYDENNEFSYAKIVNGEDQIDLLSVYGDNDIPEAYKDEGFSYISMKQYFSKWRDVHHDKDHEIFDHGLRKAAEIFGFCVVIDIPYDGLEGDLHGYRKTSTNELEAIRFPYVDDDD